MWRSPGTSAAGTTSWATCDAAPHTAKTAMGWERCVTNSVRNLGWIYKAVGGNKLPYHFPTFSFYFIFTAFLLILFYIFLYTFFTIFTVYLLPVFLHTSPALSGAIQSHLFYTTPTDSVLVPMPVPPTPYVYHFSCMAFCPNMKMRVAGSPNTLTNIHEIIQCTTHRTTTFKLLSFHITFAHQKLLFTFFINEVTFVVWAFSLDCAS